jgi:peptidyl-prolyl cis-trans isomerase C
MINCSKLIFKSFVNKNCEMRKRKTMKALKLILLVSASLAAGSAYAVDLAKVNGKVVTDHDLQTALGNLNEGQRANVLKDSNSRRQVLVNVIEQELLVQEAEKEKLDADAEYKASLAAFRKQYLASRVLAKNLSSKFSDSAAKKYYSAHSSRYSTDQVHALHILVSSEAEARELVKKAATLSEDDFQELAEKISKDPSAKNNRGDLGFFGRDRMVSEFTDAAFAGAEGSVVGPVKTSYGYHVIKVIKKKMGKPLEFSEVELRVKNDLRNELTQVYVANLKKQSKVEVDDKAVEKL